MYVVGYDHKRTERGRSPYFIAYHDIRHWFRDTEKLLAWLRDNLEDDKDDAEYKDTLAGKTVNDELILQIMNRVRKRILDRDTTTAGYCKSASIAIAKLLYPQVPTVLLQGTFDGGRHFWLRLEDGRYLDVTLDQFDGQEEREFFLGDPYDIVGQFGGYDATSIESEQPHLLEAAYDFTRPSEGETTEIPCV